MENLKNELFALRIMNSNYEEMAKCNKTQIKTEETNEVPENVKFEIFGQFLQQLFQSFDKNTKFDNFSTASTTIIHWVEEYCKPQNLNVIVESVLTDVLTNYHSNQNIIMPLDSLSHSDMGMDQDNFGSYMASYSDCQSGRPYRSMTDPSINVGNQMNNSHKSSNRTSNRRQAASSSNNNCHLQSQSSLPNILPSIDTCIDDEFMSMSPNALELAFLDSLDHNNLIDEMWLPSE